MCRWKIFKKSDLYSNQFPNSQRVGVKYNLERKGKYDDGKTLLLLKCELDFSFLIAGSFTKWLAKVVLYWLLLCASLARLINDNTHFSQSQIQSTALTARVWPREPEGWGGEGRLSRALTGKSILIICAACFASKPPITRPFQLITSLNVSRKIKIISRGGKSIVLQFCLHSGCSVWAYQAIY